MAAEWSSVPKTGKSGFTWAPNRWELPSIVPSWIVFPAHALELIRWNTKINLTAITDPLDVAVKHYIDSIATADLIPRHARLLDIGSGAGFPGIPLKIMFPSLSATLTDAVRKKVNFLNHSGRILPAQEL